MWRIVPLAAAALLACAKQGKVDTVPPDMAESRLTSLEVRTSALEERLERLESNRKVQRVPPQVDAQQEVVARDLVEELKQAIATLDYDRARQIQAEFQAKYSTTRAYRAVQRLMLEVEVVGRDEAPRRALRWLQGSDEDLQNAAATLYVFWEVWCPHCKREVPRLVQTHDNYRDRGLRVVGITQQTRNITAEAVSNFLTANRVTYPIARAERDFVEHYGVRGIPAAALVADGKVVWRGHPGQLASETIETFLD